ncbi:MAG: phenylalanine--tRNA ligase subunit beta [Candidatus Woesearchaeota archaeon]|jgi:phenylalanyl-tRNA synthetase beta chain|nr:phenylalanine--tRNA ligase subunit beta [Candidatus Woesearchaeota archaeon]
MVLVLAKQSQINKYVGKELSVEEIKETLVDMGMDIKGDSEGEDPELKIEITAEKLDMISAVGIGRAIKYYREIETQIPKYSIEDSGEKLIVKSSAKKSRPKTVAAIIRDVPMSQAFLDEIIEIQEKIHDSFGRNRKKAAIGIYPIDKIEFPITYGSEDPKNIKFQPLESTKEMNGHEILKEHDTGKKYAHLLDGLKTYPVFRDNSGKVLSMPPVINSHDTGRVELNHKDLFIECSGHNLNHLDNVLKILITTLIDMGAKAQSMEVIYEGDNEKYTLDLNSFSDEFDLDYANKLIGFNLKPEEVEKYLNRMMFGLKSIEGSKIKIEIPIFRTDVWHDVDIADDLARAYGYKNINPTFPNISSVGETLEFSQFKEKISDTMTKLEFLELYTYSITSTTEHFKKMNIVEEKEEYMKINDSAEQGINMVRSQILPDNLTSLNRNRKNKYPQKVFENGITVQLDKECDTGAKNQFNLSVSIADPKSNYTSIKGILDTLMKLNEIEFEIKESNLNFLIDGRQADIFVRGHKVGYIGELHPQILENFGLLVPISSMEINLDKIFELK